MKKTNEYYICDICGSSKDKVLFTSYDIDQNRVLGLIPVIRKNDTPFNSEVIENPGDICKKCYHRILKQKQTPVVVKNEGIR